jgi:hypothetical protein
MTLSAVRSSLASCVMLGLTLVAGCASEPPTSANPHDPSSGTGGSAPGGTGSGGAGGSVGGSAGAGGSGAVSTSPYLPARIRRLTNAEYDASVQSLLATAKRPSVEFSFPPDARQGPSNSPAGAAFSVNDAQRVDPVLAGKLDAAAVALVAEARQSGKLAELAPCADASTGGVACAETFVRTFGERAYRRPLLDDEVTHLVTRAGSAYHVGADGHSYDEGIDLLTRIVLQTPAFLYVTELGPSGAGATFELTANEIATSLAYLLTSGPPDAALRAKAAAGELATPEGREAEARRLLVTPAGRERFVRVVREWLGIESVGRREKAQNIYPDFPRASQAMENESRAFIEEVLYNSSGTLGELLTADWTIAEAPLSAVYGFAPAGAGQRTSLAAVGRRGILNQAAFLSVFATNNGSHPVFRGVAITRRVACLETKDPGALGIVVSFPPADPSKTTRTRFETHSLDPQCAGCHSTLDAFGFALENFDGMGRLRTTENELRVDTTVTLEAGSDLDGTYANSAELFEAMASSANVKECLARQLFRSSAARSDESVRAAEDAFVESFRALPAEEQDRPADILVGYAKSPRFVQRRAE